ncbi:hypothetical protein, partial [Desulfocicer vacuolatum]|uniref:hypothetical protein n=1 Tax=Desulfocicer vacuolatum TaxID=2298 RepID=UPI001BAE8A37
LILVLTVTQLTGFTYRGLAPHKFTPMPGVPQAAPLDALVLSRFLKKNSKTAPIPSASEQGVGIYILFSSYFFVDVSVSYPVIGSCIFFAFSCK